MIYILAFILHLFGKCTPDPVNSSVCAVCGKEMR